MTTIRAAAVQFSPVLYSRQATVDKLCSTLLALGREGVQFAVFPETVVPYYPYFSFVQPPFAMGKEHLQLLEQSVTVPSDVTRQIGEACREAGIVASIGVNEREGGTIYNAQLLFDADGTLIQHRRKITPTYHERMVWGQGDGSGLRAVDSAVGRIGSLACWEHYNPLARYALMADGELLRLTSEAVREASGAAAHSLGVSVPLWVRWMRPWQLRLLARLARRALPLDLEARAAVGEQQKACSPGNNVGARSPYRFLCLM